MKPFDNFCNMSPEFWAFIKLVGDKLGYTKRETKTNPDPAVKTFTYQELENLASKYNVAVSPETLTKAVEYIQLRAAALNDTVKPLLMNVNEAKSAYEQLHEVYVENGYKCKLPMNKQKGDKRQIAFFTAIINILTEDTIRKSSVYRESPGFNDDPEGLTYITSDDGSLVGASSRRFDGAYPDVLNPKVIWEIKEYYNTTTFGSRVADGVYETQLDGYEFADVSSRTGKIITHVFFLDAYSTWWEKGKSYLCRIIDILNAGLVDEVIVGREVLTRWPELLSSIIEE